MFIIISVGPHHTKNIIQNALNLMLSFIIFKSCHVVLRSAVSSELRQENIERREERVLPAARVSCPCN